METLRSKQPALAPSGDGGGEVDAVLDDSEMRRAGDVLPYGRRGPACNIHDLGVLNVSRLPADLVRPGPVRIQSNSKNDSYNVATKEQR